MTDEMLLTLYHARSEDAISETQATYGLYCKSIALRILGNEEDAQECLNDVWMQVWRAIPPERPLHFKGWLGTITRNRAISLLRARKRAPGQVELAALELSEALGPGLEESLTARELGRAISVFLVHQPQGMRRAFLRRYWYGDTIAETALTLGWNEGKTKTALFRLRNKLRAYLKKEGFFYE